MMNCRKLCTAIGAFARVLAAAATKGDFREIIRRNPTANERAAAYNLLMVIASKETLKLYEQKKISSLAPVCRRGLFMTSGRFPASIAAKNFGAPAVPILTNNSPLARLITWEAHQQCHRRDIPAVLAQTRRKAWIIKGRILVKSVIKACTFCRKSRAKLQEQIMADLPTEALEKGRPFQMVGLDLFGPIMVKGIGGQQRKQFKVWGLVYACITTKAVALWSCPGYDTASFLLAHSRQVAIYGAPSIVVSDRGSQLVAAAGDIPNWEQVQHSTAPEGTTWRFVPASTPWRNGLAERSVGLAKKILQQNLKAGELLEHTQLDTMLLQVASILNDRPLSARVFDDGEYMAITPNDLLLGRRPHFTEKELQGIADEEEILNSAQRKVQKVLERTEEWWSKWQEEVFPLLATRKKWQVPQYNVKENDIVLVKTNIKFAKNKFRLGKIVEVKHDAHRRVRTVLVAQRNLKRSAREAHDKCKAGHTLTLVPVHRIAVILPHNKTWTRDLPSQEQNI